MAYEDKLQEFAQAFKADIALLQNIVQSFNNKVTSVVEQFNDLNKKSLSINRSYTEVATRGVNVTEGLNLALNSKFSIGLELNRQAMFGNNKELVKLAATQEALGKSSAPTIAAFKNLQVALRLSEEQTNSLAKATLDSSLRYGVATEVLVNQLEKLQPVMETLSLAGQDTSQFASFVSQLTAKLGGERNADNVARALTILTDVSSKNQNMLARFGVQDLSRRLISGKGSPEEQSALAIEAIRRFSIGVQSMQGSQIENIRLLQEMTGGTAGLFLSLNKELETTTNNLKERNPAKMFTEVMDNFQNLMNSVFAPLLVKTLEIAQTLITTITPFIKKIADLVTWFSKTGESTAILSSIFIAFGIVLGAMLLPIIIGLAKALLPVIAIAAGLYFLFKTIDFLLGKFVENVLGVSYSFKQVISNFGDYLMLAAYRIAQGFYSVLSSITFGDWSTDFEKDSLEYKIKADELARDLQTRAVEASEKTEENTRKEIKIPEFIKTTNKELEDAFRVMLGLQSTNPVASQMVVLTDRIEKLVDNSNVQTENSTQTVQAQTQTVQKLELVNQNVKQKVNPLTRYQNTSRAY